MNEKSEPTIFWRKFIEGLELSPMDETLIKGASGLEHNNYAIGIDEARKRLIFVSTDWDARAVVLIRGDIQAALPGFNVIGARVILSNPAAEILQFLQETTNKADLQDLVKWIPKVFGTGLNDQDWRRLFALGVFSVSEVYKIIEFHSKHFFKVFPSREAKESEESYQRRTLDLLEKYDPLRDDLKYGICPIPLYEFQGGQLEAIFNANNAQAIQEILRQHDILQYFLPSPDHLALGLIDSGISKKNDLLPELERTPKEGHPYGKPEIIEAKSILEMIAKLQERNLLVEGESMYEITEKGMLLRNTVKFKPREGLISKIVNRFKISIDIKNIFGIGT